MSTHFVNSKKSYAGSIATVLAPHRNSVRCAAVKDGCMYLSVRAGLPWLRVTLHIIFKKIVVERRIHFAIISKLKEVREI